MSRLEDKFVQGLDNYSHQVLIGNVSGVIRTGYAIVKIALSTLQSLALLIVNPIGDHKGKNIKEGFAQLGRGLIEVIPPFGQIFAIHLDENRAKKQALEAAKKADFVAAATILEKKLPIQSDRGVIVQEICIELIKHENKTDGALKFFKQMKWKNLSDAEIQKDELYQKAKKAFQEVFDKLQEQKFPVKKHR